MSWLATGDWSKLFILASLAVAVFFAGRMLQQRRPGLGASSRPGRGGGKKNALDFDLEIARLESQAPVRIAEAKPGLVHIRGTIVSARGGLGGSPGFERIWFNQAGAPRQAAVGVELCLVQDASGQVAVEELGDARVIAPREERSNRPESLALHVGDEVELLGEFEKEAFGEGKPEERVYGVMGRSRQVQIRVLNRPDPPAPRPPEDSPTAPAQPPSDTHQG